MRRRLSHRSRRRLILLGALALAAGAVAAAVVSLPSPGKPDTGPAQAASQAAAPAAPPKQPVQRLGAADRRGIMSTLSLFISTSVARHHPERSFEVVDPVLREGMTRAQWMSGNIPVVPYPAAGVDLVTFSEFTGKRALVDVLLEPTRGSQLVRKTFQAELRLEGPHRWAVSSWVPEGVSESQYAANAASEPPEVIAAAAHPRHLSATWIFVPLGGLLAALVLTPLAILGRQHVADRRARRDFP